MKIGKEQLEFAGILGDAKIVANVKNMSECGDDYVRNVANEVGSEQTLLLKRSVTGNGKFDLSKLNVYSSDLTQ